MKRIFGQGREKVPPPTLTEASENLDKRGGVLDEKIRKLDVELHKYREQMKRVKGPAANAVKQRALRCLKQKRMYEGQRDTLYNQQYNIDQVSFTTDQMQDSITQVKAMKVATRGLKKQFKSKDLDINNIDKLTDDMADLMDQANDINDALGANYNLPDEIDEDELMGELDALEADLAFEGEGASELPSYLKEPDPLPEVPDSGEVSGIPTNAAEQQVEAPQAN